tara:strand:+ start:89 stop:766 length:678 start_codon:yes stop_codon:yes gene_type:complete
MAKRILPYRDYSEHDVVNAFSLDTASATLTSWVPNNTSNGDWDAGVIVAVSAGSLPGDSPAHQKDSGDKLRDYLGASFSSAHIGYSSYPYNDMLVVPASGQAPALGITLRETLAYDENGEKMLYYPQKLDEAQGVLPGHSVPVLTRGTILLKEDAFTSLPVVGSLLKVGDYGEAGKLQVIADAADDADVSNTDSDRVGMVLATGNNSDDTGSSKFLVKFSFDGQS